MATSTSPRAVVRELQHKQTPVQLNNTVSSRCSRPARQPSYAMLLSGLLLWVAIATTMSMLCVPVATAAVLSAQRLHVQDVRGATPSNSQVVAATLSMQTAGTGLRGLQGSGDSTAPASTDTPELARGGGDHGGDSADELLEEDSLEVEDCPADLQDVVLGPGRRLLNLCFQCPCACQFCCAIESSAFFGFCRTRNGSDIRCTEGF